MVSIGSTLAEASKVAAAEINARGVRVTYRTRAGEYVALTETNLCIGPGEFVALLGPSGCGKTTLLNAIAGIAKTSAGSVLVDGEAVTGPTARTGMVFQQHSLFPWMTALENVAFGPRRLGWKNPTETARQCLGMVGLADFCGAYPSALSGGMRQRVGLARALAIRPPVLLMDEPFGALDALTRELMQELLLTIWERQRPTVVFVTHDVDEAVFLADRIVVMGARPGRVRAELPVDLPRPRTLDVRRHAQFAELRASIGQLIRDESQRSFDAAAARVGGYVRDGAGV
jgi:NitT/TauT family transport system ATP-binding protein